MGDSQVEIRIDTWVGTTSWCVYGVICWNRFSHSKWWYHISYYNNFQRNVLQRVVDQIPGFHVPWLLLWESTNCVSQTKFTKVGLC